MAGNKFDTGFKKMKARNVKLTYDTDWGSTTFEGTVDQLLRHVIAIHKNV